MSREVDGTTGTRPALDRGPWDLELTVVDILREPDCGWKYQVGFTTRWDGRHFPKGMCPFAWNAFAPMVWELRYGRPEDPDETQLVCPDPRHMNVFQLRRVREPAEGDTLAPDRSVTTVPQRIRVDELPRGGGCARGYQVGDEWVSDGEVPDGFCALAWNVLELWVHALSRGGDPRPMGWPGDEVAYGCPHVAHLVVFRVTPMDSPKGQ